MFVNSILNFHSLSQIISSITTYLILIIQFRVEEISSGFPDPEKNKMKSMFGYSANQTFDDVYLVDKPRKLN